MSLATIRAAIVATLNTVPDIGRVHDYQRYATAQKFIELYATGGKIRGWYVRRATRASRFISYGKWEVTNSWEVRGYASLSDADASEIALDNLVESICAAVLADETLGGAVESCTTREGSGLQLTDSGAVKLVDVLCHSVGLRLQTVTTETMA